MISAKQICLKLNSKRQHDETKTTKDGNGRFLNQRETGLPMHQPSDRFMIV